MSVAQHRFIFNPSPERPHIPDWKYTNIPAQRGTGFLLVVGKSQHFGIDSLGQGDHVFIPCFEM